MFDCDAMEMENKFKQKNPNSEIQARDAQFGLTLVVWQRFGQSQVIFRSRELVSTQQRFSMYILYCLLTYTQQLSAFFNKNDSE